MTSNISSSIRVLGRIGFIGAGRLGQTLALAFARAGLQVAAVSSRRVESAKALAELVAQDRGTVWLVGEMQPDEVLDADPRVAPHVWAHAQEVVAASDTVFLTVPDDAIEPTCSALVWRSGQRVVHCSGATEVSALNAALLAGAHVAGFHPLHTFGDVQTALAGLPGCAVAVEAANSDGGVLLESLQALARAIGARPFELPRGSRALYHASAHYAGSLVVTLMDEAVRHWARFGVEPDQAFEALLPLLRSTLASMQVQPSGSRSRAGLGSGLGERMAGVVARGDAKTLGSHLSALQQVGAEERELYAQISRRSVRLALESGRISPEQASVMDRLLL